MVRAALTTKTLTKADPAHVTGSKTSSRPALCGTCCLRTWRSTSPTRAALIGFSTKSPPRKGARNASKVMDDRTATLTCDDGNGNIVFSKPIGSTDFSLDGISRYISNNTILLPREY